MVAVPESKVAAARERFRATLLATLPLQLHSGSSVTVTAGFDMTTLMTPDEVQQWAGQQLANAYCGSPAACCDVTPNASAGSSAASSSLPASSCVTTSAANAPISLPPHLRSGLGTADVTSAPQCQPEGGLGEADVTSAPQCQSGLGAADVTSTPQRQSGLGAADVKSEAELDALLAEASVISSSHQLAAACRPRH